jgi:hypothetical protein
MQLLAYLQKIRGDGEPLTIVHLIVRFDFVSQLSVQLSQETGRLGFIPHFGQNGAQLVFRIHLLPVKGLQERRRGMIVTLCRSIGQGQQGFGIAFFSQ